jgi:hypothetical protein
LAPLKFFYLDFYSEDYYVVEDWRLANIRRRGDPSKIKEMHSDIIGGCIFIVYDLGDRDKKD